MKEPASHQAHGEPVNEAGRGTLTMVMGDHGFRRMLACRLAIAAMDLATPFYVLHATEAMGLPESIVGMFTIALTAATVVASLVYSRIGARRGPHVVIRIAAVAAVAAPVYALVASTTSSRTMATLYPLVYAAIGVVSSAYLAGFGSYLLDLAPEGLHGAYIGLGNTFLGVQAFAPLAGGWLLAATSYATLFGLSAAGALVGLVLAFRLPEAIPAPIEEL
jgi:MFS family permease